MKRTDRDMGARLEALQRLQHQLEVVLHGSSTDVYVTLATHKLIRKPMS
jgi:hypothetical protein